MKTISRKEAKKQGLKFYYTGRPCKHRHISKRYVSTSGCVECAVLKAWIVDIDKAIRKHIRMQSKIEQPERIISRKDAKDKGLMYYFTGLRCANNHLADRLVSNTACVECERAKHLRRRDRRLKTMRDYRKSNKKEILAYMHGPAKFTVYKDKLTVEEAPKKR